MKKSTFIFKPIRDNIEYVFVKAFFVNYRQELKNRGYNITKFLAIHKIPKSYFYSIISGSYDRPITIYKLCWMAKLLDLTIYDLITPLDEDGNSINKVGK